MSSLTKPWKNDQVAFRKQLAYDPSYLKRCSNSHVSIRLLGEQMELSKSDIAFIWLEPGHRARCRAPDGNLHDSRRHEEREVAIASPGFRGTIRSRYLGDLGASGATHPKGDLLLILCRIGSVMLIELCSGTFDIFLHKQQLLHTSKLLCIRWPREGPA